MSFNRDISADQAETLRVLSGAAPVIRSNGMNWLGHRGGAGNAQIDSMLLRGATKREMLDARGAVDQHLNHLRIEHGLVVEEIGDIFRFGRATDVSPKSTEQAFHQAMLDGYSQAGRAVGYWGNYFLRSVRKNGGLAAAKRMMRPKSGRRFDKGFQSLLDAGRTDLSVEFAVLRPEFRSLFTKDEIREAQRRLDAVPQFAMRKSVSPEENFPNEIFDSESFVEGAVRKVVVNAYERDPKARAACLKKLGHDCAVCGVNFEDTYGEIGRGFIHVHHKKPLAGRRKEYRVNPTRDLAPVCPNCHAMLHTRNPPLGIDELKSILDAQKANDCESADGHGLSVDSSWARRTSHVR